MRIKDLLIISACDSSMGSWGKIWIEQIRKFDVDWKIYDLGGFGRGEPVDLNACELTENNANRQFSTF
uniref:hypothetical protein n=1 Tax=uncultured Gimesia sp. TaxID=1678688 RepID=UPI0026126F56